MAVPNPFPGSNATTGLNKEQRLAKEAEMKLEDAAPVLNRPFPFGGVAFPARVFGARRSDQP